MEIQSTKEYLQSKLNADYYDNHCISLINSLPEHLQKLFFKFTHTRENARLIDFFDPILAKANASLNKTELSSDNTLTALALIDRLPRLMEKNFRYISIGVHSTSHRMNYFQTIFEHSANWDEEKTKVLEYFFTPELVPLVLKGWDLVATLTYQEGYYRRSFRSKQDHHLFLNAQINYLLHLIDLFRYNLTIEEFVAYSQELNNRSLKYFLAIAINEDYLNIRSLLLDVVYCRHDKIKPSRTIIQAMLLSDDEECWIAVEKLLLSAQRQEGLRQTILESLDETSIGAFKHFIVLLRKEKMTRFSSVIRAVGVWTGLGWEAVKQKTVDRTLELAEFYLLNPDQIAQAMDLDDNLEIFMALWSQAFIEVYDCRPLLEKLLQREDEKKLLALYFCQQVNIGEFVSKLVLPFVTHPNRFVASQTIHILGIHHFEKDKDSQQRINLYTSLFAMITNQSDDKQEETTAVFSWLHIEYNVQRIKNFMIELLDLTNDEQIDLIQPLFKNSNSTIRETIASRILSWPFSNEKNYSKASARVKEFAFRCIEDRSSWIKSLAFGFLKHIQLSDNQIECIELLLKNSSSSVRTNCIELLTIGRTNLQIKASIDRLVNQKSVNYRLAGLDLLVFLNKEANDEQDWIIEKVNDYQKRKNIGEKERLILSSFELDINRNYTKENGFGLYNPANVPTASTFPTFNFSSSLDLMQNNGFSLHVDQINQQLQKLKEIFIAHKDYEYTVTYDREELGRSFDEMSYSKILGQGFVSTIMGKTKGSKEEIYETYPLHELWTDWFINSGLTRSDLLLLCITNTYRSSIQSDKRYKSIQSLLDPIFSNYTMSQIPENEWYNPLETILSVLSERYPCDNYVEICFGLLQRFFTIFNENNQTFCKISDAYEHMFDRVSWKGVVESTILSELTNREKQLNDQHFIHYFNLLQWYVQCEPTYRYYCSHMTNLSIYSFARAYKLELITNDELMNRIFDEYSISQLTNRRKVELFDEFPFLIDKVDQCRDRILEIELLRGDSETAVSKMASQIQSIYGVEYFCQILSALGKEKLSRCGVGYVNASRSEMFSRFLSVSFPFPHCTHDEFNTALAKIKPSEQRLCEIALYCPQWVSFIANYLKWEKMESAIWWLRAHTVNNEKEEGMISKYSAVKPSAFKEGAIDIDWFQDNYKSLKKAKWEKLVQSAKYITDGNGHARAVLYADVLTGKKKIKEIKAKIDATRNKDYLRVFGIVPLSKTNPQKDLLQRYQLIQKFRLESKQFGSQRQESEKIASQIAMENLARTAGYNDPIRLQWAMETKEAQQIINNTKAFVSDETCIELIIDEHGKARVRSMKKGKELKNIPAKLKKEKEVCKLVEYAKVLQQQYKRTRSSLENLMITGDYFTIPELESLFQHPVVAPLLEKLVFVSDKKVGFYKDQCLIDPSNEVNAIESTVRLAHPVDLYESGKWSRFQRHCFEEQIVQPFKQIFRELYVPTSDEQKNGSYSRRYDGHQVQPKKTLALLKGKGWTVDYYDGLQRVFHQQDTIASLDCMADWFSPADVEAPTLETVRFYHRIEETIVPISQVNPILFSETMRDIDLVVSVAHIGEVDPEASQSSIELRRVIVEETARLFQLDNLEMKENHVYIRGKMGDYSVHLGSGVCHQIAGSSLSILPVHSQHRGRMFLPFIDGDPKTAEILSKVLLLSKDNEINDPTILSQLR